MASACVAWLRLSLVATHWLLAAASVAGRLPRPLPLALVALALGLPLEAAFGLPFGLAPGFASATVDAEDDDIVVVVLVAVAAARDSEFMLMPAEA